MAAVETMPARDAQDHDEEQPAARLVRLGAEALSGAELLALVLGGGARPFDRAVQELLARTGGIRRLAQADALELEAGGLTAARAARLACAFELGKRAMQRAEDRIRIDSPEKAAELLLPLVAHGESERFLALYLDARSAMIARRTIAIGAWNASLVDPRAILRAGLELRAIRILLAHTHPNSGDPTPSSEDIELTRRLVEAGRVIGIEVIDHIILGDDRFESLRTRGIVSFG
ncbi:MAG: DNA repair protein RadC [Acidobacteriota bacterium]